MFQKLILGAIAFSGVNFHVDAVAPTKKGPKCRCIVDRMGGGSGVQGITPSTALTVSNVTLPLRMDALSWCIAVNTARVRLKHEYLFDEASLWLFKHSTA
jgi:hypothetical protein